MCTVMHVAKRLLTFDVSDYQAHGCKGAEGWWCYYHHVQSLCSFTPVWWGELNLIWSVCVTAPSCTKSLYISNPVSIGNSPGWSWNDSHCAAVHHCQTGGSAPTWGHSHLCVHHKNISFFWQWLICAFQFFFFSDHRPDHHHCPKYISSCVSKTALNWILVVLELRQINFLIDWYTDYLLTCSVSKYNKSKCPPSSAWAQSDVSQEYCIYNREIHTYSLFMSVCIFTW